MIYKMKITFYKLLDKTNNKCYIGSTKNIKKRISIHKCYFNKYKENNKLNYCSSYEILKNENYELIILEEIEYNNLEDLNNRFLKEREYLEKEQDAVNRYIPSRTPTERSKKYYETNKNKLKEYYKLNRERLLARQNSYYNNEQKRERIKKYNKNRYWENKNINR